ncbi:MAG: ribonuclease HII [Candidatus Saccharibacteria bacterium]|nr:ribonuclease HII [Candidatus Saccharibacteria bacterium]
MAILGIDEVGRGPLAGPLVVGAVILEKKEDSPRPEWFDELRDSKKLSASKREKLSELILNEAAATGVGFVSAAELDRVGVSEALRLATRRAVKSVQRLHAPFSQIVIDGKVNFLAGTALEKYVTTVVRADDLVREVSAASIIAKVARDRYMAEVEAELPGYGFSKNVGYGTKAHMAAISSLGISPEHRLSYEPCKSMVGFSREEIVRKNTTKIGMRGEEAACSYLVSLGHEIISRNFRTRMCEIDIVSVFEGKIYFTEVKYRKNQDFGGGLMAVDKKKLEKMRFSAESFLKFRPEYRDLDPLLAVASVTGVEFVIKDFIILN